MRGVARQRGVAAVVVPGCRDLVGVAMAPCAGSGSRDRRSGTAQRGAGRRLSWRPGGWRYLRRKLLGYRAERC